MLIHQGPQVSPTIFRAGFPSGGPKFHGYSKNVSSGLPADKTWETFKHDWVSIALRQQLDQLGHFISAAYTAKHDPALHRQLRNLGGQSGVVGTAAPVAVGQGSGTVLAVGSQHPASVAWGHAQQLSSLGDGHLVFQNGVEHGDSGLFFLIQRNILHRKDIFADQLADDGIVEQQHIFVVYWVKDRGK